MPAPWPGATEEESLAYEAATRLGDAEFENIVVKQGGPRLREYVSADKVDVYDAGQHSEALAFYKPGFGKKSSSLLVALDKVLGTVTDTFGIKMPPREFQKEIDTHITQNQGEQAEKYKYKPDHIGVLGAENADPRILAHEFTHRRHWRQPLRPNTLGKPSLDSMRDITHSERETRLADAFRANTPEQWADAVQRWVWQTGSDDWRESEQELKEVLANREEQFLKEEVVARKDDRPMNRTDGEAGLYRDQKDALERRKQAWSVDEYQERDQRDWERLNPSPPPPTLAEQAQQLETRRYLLSDEYRKKEIADKQMFGVNDEGEFHPNWAPHLKRWPNQY